ncbi:MAG: pyridoxamine 5'-phosphate oxidase family protein [Candidatus Shapirobacteria bacterium]|jgi:predicted pyridoxine 5'-phosphate oxidase superfamily flavin-nucleotide-binding protein
MSNIQSLLDLKSLLESSILALATSSPDGHPNCVAIGCIKVVSPSQLLITDNFFNKTASNLASNPFVSLAFWSSDGETGYQIKGKASYFTSGPWKQAVDEDPNNKNLAHKAAVLVTVTEIWDLATPALIFKK